MILGIYGHSKAGKTMLIERLVPVLVKRRYKIAVLKHIGQKGFTIDTAGKDTWRFSEAGASIVGGASDRETFFILRKRMSLEDMCKFLNAMETDIILVEGFKGSSIQKVAVGEIKEERNTVFRYRGEKRVRRKIADFLDAGVQIERTLSKLPGLNCGKCGFDCKTMAGMVVKKKKRLVDCANYSKIQLSLKVNGDDILLGRFAKEMFSGTLIGALSSLKGVKKPKKVKIRLMMDRK